MNPVFFMLTVELTAPEKRAEVLSVIERFYRRWKGGMNAPPPGVLSQVSDQITASENGAIISSVITYSGVGGGLAKHSMQGLAEEIRKAAFKCQFVCNEFETVEGRERRESREKTMGSGR